MRKILTRILKVIAYLAGGMLLVGIILALFTQTDFFRNRLRIILASAIATTTHGSVHIGVLEGNLLYGFSVDSLSIAYGNETVLSTGRVTARYEPWALLRNSLRMRSLIIEHPTVHFVRTTDGVWNIASLLNPDTSQGPGGSPWRISLDDLQLQDASVTLDDSASLAAPGHWDLPSSFVEYHRFSVRDLSLQLSAEIAPGSIVARIAHASCYSPESKFHLTQFKGDVSVTERGARLGNAVIQTGRSSLELDASLRNVNLLGGFSLESLQHDSARVQLRARNLDLGELKSFLPQVKFLEGSVSLELDAAGEFGNLLVKHLQLNTYRSTLNLSGTVRNLHRPEDLILNVQIVDTKLFPADAAQLMPPFGIPPFDSVGQVSLAAEFTGRPLNFRTRSSLKGSFGAIEVSGEMNLERSVPTYRGTFATSRLDLGPMLGRRQWRTMLNATGSLTGEGFALDELASTLSLEIDSSLLRGMTVSSSSVTVNARNRQIEASGTVRGGEMSADVRGRADYADRASPRYDATFTLARFDLAPLLGDPAYESSLTLQGTAGGSGHELDDINVEADLSLLPSMFQGHEIQRQDIHLSLDQRRKDARHLSLRSGIADIDFDGVFDLDLTISALVRQTENLLETIDRHARTAEPGPGLPAPSGALRRVHALADRKLDCSYAVAVKNLEPLAELFRGSPFDAKARFTGRLTGSADNISLSLDGSFEEFYVGSVRGGVLLNDGRVSVAMESLKETNTLEDLSVSATLEARSGHVNTAQLDRIALALGYKGLAGAFHLGGIVDSAYDLRLAGNASVQPHTYVFDFDTAAIALGGYRWENDQDIQCRWDEDGFRIMRGAMKRNGELLAVAGVVHADGKFDAEATLRNFDLRGVNVLSGNAELTQEGQGFSGTADADLRLAGSTRSPEITFRSSMQDAYFRQTRIGTVRAGISYAAELARLDVVVHTAPADTMPSLTVKGTLPINLALAGVEERFPDEEQHIQVVSDGFDVSVLDPLLRDVDELSGTIRSNVLLAGTTQSPRYSGAITLTNVRFLFGPNNIAYTVSGDLVPAQDRILVNDLVVRNVPYRGKVGEAHFTGSVSMKNFRLGDFDLHATGQILLMTEATRKQIPAMYGTLFTAIGLEGLKITGTLDRPFLAGTLSVLDANLVFPPTAAAVATNSNLSLEYVVIDDTTSANHSGPRPSKFYGLPEAQAVRLDRGAHPQASPLLDRLRYNLNVETQGITAVKMIFTPATSEELYAELSGSVVAMNSQGTPSIYGEIEVAPRSYYNFFKKFDATGKLKFVGQWDNPELDVLATYEGVRQVSESQLGEQPGVVTTAEQRTTEQKVLVELTIKGPRLNPRLDMAMKVQSRPGGGYEDWSGKAQGGDVQSDVISFIVTGKFRDQLTARDQQELTNIGSSTGGSVASNLLSGIFSDYLRQEFSFVRSVDVNYQGGSFSEGTNVNITASAGIGQLRVGGKIFNDLGNTNLTYQVNLVRNLFLEIQRKVNSDITEDKRLTNEARLYYRFSF